MTKFIILDRDGVINHDSATYIKSPDEWIEIPGSLEAIATLNRAGYQVVVATNQSGVARGYYDLEMLSAIHEKFIHRLAAVGGYIDEIFFCPHHPNEMCECRKPKPGMFYKIQQRYAVDLTNVYYIGDTFSDIEVALAVGCKPILVLTGNGQKTLEENPELKKIPHFSDLSAAASSILTKENA